MGFCGCLISQVLSAPSKWPTTNDLLSENQERERSGCWHRKRAAALRNFRSHSAMKPVS